MPAEFVDQNAGGSSGGAAAELPVRTVVRWPVHGVQVPINQAQRLATRM
jgi:hypothetical protein